MRPFRWTLAEGIRVIENFNRELKSLKRYIWLYWSKTARMWKKKTFSNLYDSVKRKCMTNYWLWRRKRPIIKTILLKVFCDQSLLSRKKKSVFLLQLCQRSKSWISDLYSVNMFTKITIKSYRIYWIQTLIWIASAINHNKLQLLTHN